MAFRINESDGELVAGERLYLTADGERVVPEGDPEARVLLAAEGQPVDRETAERHGLLKGRSRKRKAG